MYTQTFFPFTKGCTGIVLSVDRTDKFTTYAPLDIREFVALDKLECSNGLTPRDPNDVPLVRKKTYKLFFEPRPSQLRISCSQVDYHFSALELSKTGEFSTKCSSVSMRFFQNVNWIILRMQITPKNLFKENKSCVV
jgi:hypothetical protein